MGRLALAGSAAAGIGLAVLPELWHRLCCIGTLPCMHACSQHAGVDRLLGTHRMGAATFAQARHIVSCMYARLAQQGRLGAPGPTARRCPTAAGAPGPSSCAGARPRRLPHAPPAPARTARSGRRPPAPSLQRRRSGRPAAATGGTPCARPLAPPDPQGFALGRGRSCGQAGAGAARQGRAAPLLVTVRALAMQPVLAMSARRRGAGGGCGAPAGAPPHPPSMRPLCCTVGREVATSHMHAHSCHLLDVIFTGQEFAHLHIEKA